MLLREHHLNRMTPRSSRHTCVRLVLLFTLAMSSAALLGRARSAEESELLTHSEFAGCSARSGKNEGGGQHVRVATWNIEAARSAPVDEIAAELRRMDVDVAALQEVDVRTRRTGYIDEPRALAASLS